MFLVYDTETTGLPQNYRAPLTDSENWPRLVQLAWQLHDVDGSLISRGNRIVKPEGFKIPFTSSQIHGITTERALEEGSPLKEVIEEFNVDLSQAKYVMGHNIEFDISIVGAEQHRLGLSFEELTGKGTIDSKLESTEYCAIPGGRGGRFKWPTLTEVYSKLFGEGFDDAHDAAYDVDATAKVFFELCKRGVITRPEIVDKDSIVYESPELEKANFSVNSQSVDAEIDQTTSVVSSEELEVVNFSHLHSHSQFSVLQAVSSVEEIVNEAASLKMPAVALTDIGNMMSAFLLVREANKAGLKPIVGVELNVCKDMNDTSNKDDGYPTVFLAKNKDGYHNLVKLASKAYTDGFYYVPRIDRKLFEEYNENIVVLTGGLFGEIPSKILNIGEKQAEEAFIYWKETLGENFYAELNRHGLEEESVVNSVLLELCEKHEVKYVATNNTFYTFKNQSEAQDILLCVKDAKNVSQTKRYMGRKSRDERFGLPNDEFYYKSQDEMKALFADLPEAIRNVETLVNEFENYRLLAWDLISEMLGLE